MKALLINGSQRPNGNTSIALRAVSDSLREENVDTEILQVPKTPVSGCCMCYRCRTAERGRCAIKDDIANALIEKIIEADALVLGSPVYFAGPSGQLKAALDRVFFIGAYEGFFAGKPGAAVCAVRRGGAVATIDALQNYFTICGMPVAPSTYWPIIHGLEPDEAYQDSEGVQAMQMLGKTLAWMMKCFSAGKSIGVLYPDVPGGERITTNFIR